MLCGNCGTRALKDVMGPPRWRGCTRCEIWFCPDCWPALKPELALDCTRCHEWLFGLAQGDAVQFADMGPTGPTPPAKDPAWGRFVAWQAQGKLMATVLLEGASAKGGVIIPRENLRRPFVPVVDVHLQKRRDDWHAKIVHVSGTQVDWPWCEGPTREVCLENFIATWRRSQMRGAATAVRLCFRTYEADGKMASSLEIKTDKDFPE